MKHADAAQIAGDPDAARFFEAAMDGAPAKLGQAVANVVVNDLVAFLRAAGATLAASPVTPAQVRSLAELLASDAITSKQGREVFDAMAETGEDPAKIVDERGMRQVSDTSALKPVVDEVISACPDQVAQYRGGNAKVIGYLVGQCMKASHGKGNPKLFNQLLAQKMSE